MEFTQRTMDAQDGRVKEKALQKDDEIFIPSYHIFVRWLNALVSFKSFKSTPESLLPSNFTDRGRDIMLRVCYLVHSEWNGTVIGELSTWMRRDFVTMGFWSAGFLFVELRRATFQRVTSGVVLWWLQHVSPVVFYIPL